MKVTRPRYGRRTNLEARRLLGVEAQDAGLLLRPPAAARRARRALALLQGAAARPSRRRGPLRRVGLIARHHFGILACTGQLCVCSTRPISRSGMQVAASKSQLAHRAVLAPRRLQGAFPPVPNAVDCKERTHIAGALRLVAAGEADTWRCYKPIAQCQPSRTGVAAHINCLCSAPSTPAARAVVLQCKHSYCSTAT